MLVCGQSRYSSFYSPGKQKVWHFHICQLFRPRSYLATLSEGIFIIALRMRRSACGELLRDLGSGQTTMTLSDLMTHKKNLRRCAETSAPERRRQGKRNGTQIDDQRYDPTARASTTRYDIKQATELQILVESVSDLDQWRLSSAQDWKL